MSIRHNGRMPCVDLLNTAIKPQATHRLIHRHQTLRLYITPSQKRKRKQLIFL